MIGNGTEKLVATKQIVKAWNIRTASGLPEFLAARGIHPAAAAPFGLGVMRMYPESVLNLRADFIAERERKRAKSTANLVARAPTGRRTRSNLDTRLSAIEMALQQIKDRLGIR